VSATCAECRTLLGGYVMHALEPAEAETVRRHLAACAACAAEHGQLMGIPVLLDVAGPQEASSEEPPPALEEAVLDRFAREHRGGVKDEPDRRARSGRRSSVRERLRAGSRRLAHPIPAALAGAAAAAAITAALLVLPRNDEPAGEQYRASLAGSRAAPGATASADLRVLSAGTHVRLRVHGLRGSPGTVYELWCLREDGAKVSAGTFRTDGSGAADVNLTTAAVPGEYHRLSVERKAFAPPGSPGEPVMAGEIQYPHS
jgi:anti-sigma-K factor RskA